MGIQGVDSAVQPRSIYVGRLSDKMTINSLRQHLQEAGNNNISDIIKLNCRSPGQSSFCIVADEEAAENALYDDKIWPLGVKVRPYGEKKAHNKQASAPAQGDHNRRRQNQRRPHSPQQNRKYGPNKNSTPKDVPSQLCAHPPSLMSLPPPVAPVNPRQSPTPVSWVTSAPSPPQNSYAYVVQMPPQSIPIQQSSMSTRPMFSHQPMARVFSMQQPCHDVNPLFGFPPATMAFS